MLTGEELGSSAAAQRRSPALFDRASSHRDAERRFLVCCALAGLLHTGLALFRARHWAPSSASSWVAPPSAASTELQISLDEAARVGPLPGGGSVVPEAKARVSAPAQSIKPLRPAPLVQRAPEPNERARVTANLDPEGAHDPDTFPIDLLASNDDRASDRVRPSPARRQLLPEQRQPESRAARDAALQMASASRSPGEGFGANGGPGGMGRGRGNGVVGQSFAFGGPSGAFRATVCFIEPSVQRLTDITVCDPVLTFFTTTLNVTPRQFNQGFPGLGARTEWFAIKYRGKFTVQHEDAYIFRLLSDDGSLLQIDGRTVIQNDGQHMPRSVSGDIRLGAGEHEFYVFYYQGPAAFLALQLFVRRFAHEEQLFSPSL